MNQMRKKSHDQDHNHQILKKLLKIIQFCQQRTHKMMVNDNSIFVLFISKFSFRLDKLNQIFRRSDSAESSNIPVVDDKSIDSTSETDQHKRRRVKATNKDVETNTDSKNVAHHTSTNGNHQQQQGELFNIVFVLFYSVISKVINLIEEKKHTTRDLRFNQLTSIFKSYKNVIFVKKRRLLGLNRPHYLLPNS